MERPKAPAIAPRTITPEIMYLDEMRRRNQAPGSFDDLTDMAIQLYGEEADLCRQNGTRPHIMDEYE